MPGPEPLFDRSLLDRRRRRALRQPRIGADFLLAAAADDLLDRLGAVNRRFPLAADLGTPLPLLAERLAASGRVGRVVRLDRLGLAATGGQLVVGDEEALPFAPQCLDLAVSALAFQFTNDLPGALAQVRRALKPDGLLLCVLLGNDSLAELRDSLTGAEAELRGGASPRVAPFVDLRTAGSLLQRAGFALPVVDQDRLTARYDTLIDLAHDLRAMGAANSLAARSRRPPGRAVLARADALYRMRHADADGRLRATFDLVWLSGWAPHESQQQPLRPGSARARLAEALGTVERSAGDKAGR